MRRFDFESDIYETLSCVPMAVRHKLDYTGIKITLEQWEALPLAERRILCEPPRLAHCTTQASAHSVTRFPSAQRPCASNRRAESQICHDKSKSLVLWHRSTKPVKRMNLCADLDGNCSAQNALETVSK